MSDEATTTGHFRDQPLHIMPLLNEGQAAERADGPETPAGRALRLAVQEVMEGSTTAIAAAHYGLPEKDLALAIERFVQGVAHRARKPGARAWSPTRRKLTTEQEQDIVVRVEQGMVVGGEGLWSREAVHALVLERTGLALAERTLSTYLERWGFAPGKPMRRLHHRHPALMRAWMVRDYPVVAMQAREEDGLLYWFSSIPLHAGETHARRSAGTERSMHITYVITNRGHARWMVHPNELDGAGLLDFLDRLSVPGSPKFFLLVEDLPLFAEPVFIEWSVANKHRYSFHFLPAVSRVAFTAPADRRP